MELQVSHVYVDLNSYERAAQGLRDGVVAGIRLIRPRTTRTGPIKPGAEDGADSCSSERSPDEHGAGAV